MLLASQLSPDAAKLMTLSHSLVQHGCGEALSFSTPLPYPPSMLPQNSVSFCLCNAWQPLRAGKPEMLPKVAPGQKKTKWKERTERLRTEISSQGS